VSSDDPFRFVNHTERSDPRITFFAMALSSLHDIPKIRLLVLGDSGIKLTSFAVAASVSRAHGLTTLHHTGVGKTSFVHQLCQDSVIENARWTVGCSVDVKVRSEWVLVD